MFVHTNEVATQVSIEVRSPSGTNTYKHPAVYPLADYNPDTAIVWEGVFRHFQ
jgi:hypothetical protein